MNDVLAYVAVGLFLWAAATDVKERRIPNRVGAALAALGIVRIAVALADDGAAAAAILDIAIAAAVFALGAAAFAFRLLGGGDVKLLAAGTLWVGAVHAAAFVGTTVIAGGVLAAAFLLWRLATSRSGDRPPPTLPYGVAIAAGGAVVSLGAL